MSLFCLSLAPWPSTLLQKINWRKTWRKSKPKPSYSRSSWTTKRRSSQLELLRLKNLAIWLLACCLLMTLLINSRSFTRSFSMPDEKKPRMKHTIHKLNWSWKRLQARVNPRMTPRMITRAKKVNNLRISNLHCYKSRKGSKRRTRFES